MACDGGEAIESFRIGTGLIFAGGFRNGKINGFDIESTKPDRLVYAPFSYHMGVIGQICRSKQRRQEVSFFDRFAKQNQELICHRQK